MTGITSLLLWPLTSHWYYQTAFSFLMFLRCFFHEKRENIKKEERCLLAHDHNSHKMKRADRAIVSSSLYTLLNTLNTFKKCNDVNEVFVVENLKWKQKSSIQDVPYLKRNTNLIQGRGFGENLFLGRLQATMLNKNENEPHKIFSLDRVKIMCLYMT